MSNAGRGAALPSDSEPTVDAITCAYVEAADGDALAALRLAVAMPSTASRRWTGGLGRSRAWFPEASSEVL